ncbi:hypothetical protein VFA_004140 [Vibrio furnissii CIP 102972]|nr:hypothetical protein VFA_004140 [Vibrio furnissii CIP 102972]
MSKKTAGHYTRLPAERNTQAKGQRTARLDGLGGQLLE